MNAGQIVELTQAIELMGGVMQPGQRFVITQMQPPEHANLRGVSGWPHISNAPLAKLKVVEDAEQGSMQPDAGAVWPASGGLGSDRRGAGAAAAGNGQPEGHVGGNQAGPAAVLPGKGKGRGRAKPEGEGREHKAPRRRGGGPKLGFS